MFNRRLWQQGLFLRFFVGASISIIGNWFNTVAITVLTYRLTGQVSLVAVSIMALVLPRVLLTPIGGALADRFERRRLLVALDGARALVALLPLFAQDRGSLWIVYVAILLLQAGTCVYGPAQRAYLPRLLPDDLLEAANAAYATMCDIGLFAGPALASAVLGLWGTAAAFWCNALSFLISAGLLLTLPRAAQGAARAVRLRALVGGYAGIVRRYPRIAALYLCYLAAVAPIFFFQAVMVVYVKVLGQSTAFVGILYGVAGLGGVLGGLIMSHYLRRLSADAAILVYALSVPLLGALALVHQVGVALVLLLCSTAAGTTGDIFFTVSVQRHVAPEERGRAFGMWYWCMALGQFVGAGLGSVVTTSTAVQALLWVSFGALPFVVGGVALSVLSGRQTGAVDAGMVAERAL